MENLNDSAPGEKPAAVATESQTAEAGVKPPVVHDPIAPGLESFDSAALLEALEDSEQPEEERRTPNAGLPTPNEKPIEEAAQVAGNDGGDQGEEASEQPGESGDSRSRGEAPKGPQRLSLRALPADQQVALATAMDLVRQGKAADIASALAAVSGQSQERRAESQAETAEQPSTVQARQEPSRSAVEAIKGQIKELREQRRDAKAVFDHDKELALTEQIEDLQLEQVRAEQAAQMQATQAESYQRSYEAAVDAMEARYPDAQDPDSPFSRVLDGLIAGAQSRNDPKLRNPNFIGDLADEVAEMLGVKNGEQGAESRAPKGKGAAPSPAPPPPAPARAARPAGSALAPGNAPVARPSYEQMSKMIHEMPLEELERLVCTE